MKKIIILFSLTTILASCEEKEPTCIECFNGAELVFSGCIEDYDSMDIDELEETVKQLFRPERCERY